MAAAGPSRADVLSLFRNLLRTARQFSDYNIREYTRRRAADAFRESRALADAPAAAAAFADGKKQLEVAKRQAVVYSLYAPKVRSVVEMKMQGSTRERESRAAGMPPSSPGRRGLNLG